MTTIVKREDDGNWYAHKAVYSGEDAKILDMLFGYNEEEKDD